MAPPTHVGAWSMAVMLGQPFEYYYYCGGVERAMTMDEASSVSPIVCSVSVNISR